MPDQELADAVAASCTGDLASPLAHTPADPLEIIARAVERGFDADQLGKLMDLQERYEKRKAETAYWEAMSECQKEMPAVVKDRKNPHTNSRYAAFESLNKAIRPVYTKHGFSLSFTEEPGAAEGKLRMVCTVAHRSGHRERHLGDYAIDGEGPKGGKSSMNAIQGRGSTASYAKRYLCKDIFNLAEADEDNDGAGAFEPLTADQVYEINTAIEECAKVGAPVDMVKLWKWQEVEGMAQLPAKKFTEVLRFINAKRRKAGAK